MLEGLQPAIRKPNCRVRSVLEELDEQDQQILLNALADEKTWAAKALEKALKTRGITLADTTISRHRQGMCACLKN